MAKKKTKNTGQKLSLRKQKPLSPKLAKKLLLAYSFHQKGDVNQAKDSYEQILAERPSHAETNFLFGLLISQEGFPKQSEVFLSKAVQATPSEPRYLVGFGFYY
jgi:Tfp pilus assembly protein PilF